MCFHTLPDYYLNADTANLAINIHIKDIIKQIVNGDYYIDEKK